MPRSSIDCDRPLASLYNHTMTQEPPHHHELNADDVQPVIVYAQTGREGRVQHPTHPLPSLLNPGDSTARALACFLLLVFAIQIALNPAIKTSQWGLTAKDNSGVAEGVAWLNGRLNIDPDCTDPADPKARPWDTACHRDPADGKLKVYSVLPPLVALLTVALKPVHDILAEAAPEGTWSPWTMVWLMFWPMVLMSFIALRTRLRESPWSAFLAFGLIGGTAILPELVETGRGMFGQMNHILSQTGLLLILWDLFGKRRIWPALIGLLIAGYTRQLTFLYAPMILWAAWIRWRAKGLVISALGVAVVAAPLLVLNYLKFQNPLDFGYKHIYVNRDDEVAVKCNTEGVFSTKFIPENAYFFFAAPFEVRESSPISLRFEEGNQQSTSLWLTCPLFLLIFVTVGKWWREPLARGLMLCTLPIIFGHLCYHSPGWQASGFNRFALDYLPVWLVVIAPWTRQGWKTWFTLFATAWSVWYLLNLPVCRP